MNSHHWKQVPALILSAAALSGCGWMPDDELHANNNNNTTQPGGSNGNGGSSGETTPPVTTPPVTEPPTTTPEDPGSVGTPAPETPPSETTPPVTTPPVTTPPVTTPPVTTPPVTTPPVTTPPVTTPPITTPPVTPPPLTPAQKYPEPVGAKYQVPDARAFYDKDKTGAPRAVRNDLGGTLPGMVQFVQSHSVDPSGNEAKEMPRLTMQREALLLITPDPALQDVDDLQVSVTVNGQSKGTLALKHPNLIPRSDYSNRDGRPDYVYSLRTWSVVLPWDSMVPGLELRVSDSKNRTGTLAANAIDFSGAGELVLHSVRLGMLTDPPNGNHRFLTNTIDAATDYLQTIPAARITAAYYENVKLSKVIVASGVIYDTQSATNGDVYSGDMRENTGKSTFSVGINLANWGVTSAGMASQSQPQVTQAAVIHHARGMYANGAQTHGLSGGNGILTLIDSVGNEFSHEIGHHYGLGHYPGAVTVDGVTNYFWSVHHHDSGWGYIAYRKRMRANINWQASKTYGPNGMPVLDDTYAFNKDAMAGGNHASALSNYTQYTGYSTKQKIQPAFDRAAVYAPDAPTGYRKWNASTRAMEDVSPAIPNQSDVWYNSASGKFLKPRRFGVPVVTLLGGYDPTNNTALIYPALRSNWGNVFTLPTQAVSTTEPRQCWLQVDFTTQPSQRIAVAGKRLQSGSINKLHVNLAQDEQPRRAELKCQTPGQAEESLYVLDIPTNQPAMTAPVVVGKEQGYSALRAAELPQLDSALQALAGKAVPVLPASAQVQLASWGDDTQGLSAAAQTQLARYQQQQSNAQRLNRWMDTYASALDQGLSDAQTALLDFVQTLGLYRTPLIPAGQTMKMANGNCIQKTGDSGVRIAGKSLCSGDINEQWILDSRGAIRSRANMDLCLTDQGGSNAVKLARCDTSNDAQAWNTSTANRYSRSGRCLDLNQGFLTNNIGTLITYTCSGGANQFWAGLVMSDNPLLFLVGGAHLQRLESAAANAKPSTSVAAQRQR